MCDDECFEKWRGLLFGEDKHDKVRLMNGCVVCWFEIIEVAFCLFVMSSLNDELLVDLAS